MTSTQRKWPQLTGTRGFLLLWFGQFVSLIGSSLTRFGVVYWAWEETGRPLILGTLLLMALLPSLFFGLLGGALVDRWNRKWVMALSDCASGIVTFVLVGLYVTGNLRLEHVYVATLLLSLFEGFQMPAFTTIVTLMLPKEEYARFNGLRNTSQQAARIIAPFIAAAVLAKFGLLTIFTLDAITFFFAVGVLPFIAIPDVPGKEQTFQKRFRDELLFGIKYIWESAPLRAMTLVLAGANFFNAMGFSILNAYYLARSGGSEFAYAAGMSVYALGYVLGGMLMLRWGGPKRNRILWAYVPLIVAFLFGNTTVGLGRSLPMWLVSTFIAAFWLPIGYAVRRALLQRKVPPALQGRVFGAEFLFVQAPVAAAYVIGPLLAEKVFQPFVEQGAGPVADTLRVLVGTDSAAGIALLFVVTGLSAATVVAIGLMVPALRHFEALLPDFDEAPQQQHATLPSSAEEKAIDEEPSAERAPKPARS